MSPGPAAGGSMLLDLPPSPPSVLTLCQGSDEHSGHAVDQHHGQASVEHQGQASELCVLFSQEMSLQRTFL